METIGSALSHKRNLSSARISGIRIRIGSRDAKLLYRIRWHIQHARERVPKVLIVDANSIKRHIRLIAAHPVHRSAACVGRFVVLRGSGQVGHTRLEAQ
jgi:hypothetical protein